MSKILILPVWPITWSVIINTWFPSGLNSTLFTGDSKVHVCTHSPVSTLHSLAVKSALPVTAKTVSGSISIDQMVPLWPIKVPSRSPLDEYQIEASLPLETEKSKSPSLLNFTWVNARS
ncbi:hypothetical protein OGAPHI_003226 [Ogataea philodendri]|uniref:Uncharacterized protein n=1 Tax=Ogataea philodendri TaxID=1378263 RepID=A0A9P8P8I4_9ASCO|nr:uncharacterized protein OGAPHI_003226 [Ogataea philodendri]KAH3666777.1 hypothetical protein OGAPHI_003226 [Ogataea philodendri]